jgi:Glycosyltransferase family 87
MFPQKIKLHFTSIAGTAIGFIAAYTVYLLTRKLVSETFNTVTIFLLSTGLFFYAAKAKQFQQLVNNVLLGISLFLAVHLLYFFAKTYLHIPEFDFLCFYIFGKAGVASADFYNPKVFAQVYNQLNLQNLTSKEFADEIVNVGFWYPPHSMLLFMVLGVMDLKTGYAIWQTVIIAFLIADIILLHKKYYRQLITNNKNGLADFPLLLLILLFPGIDSSVYFSQTISVFLFFLLLLISNDNSFKSGIYLALLITIKPLAVFFVLYFFVFKKWKTIGSLFLSGAVLLVVSLLFFGYQPFITYLQSPPTLRIPASVFYESLNHSLNAVLLRLSNRGVNFFDIKIAGYAIGLFLVGVTIFSSRVLAKASPVRAFMVYIPMALIIYPGSLISYSILLLPVILYLYTQKIFESEILNLLFILLLYSTGLYSLFLLNSILWIILTNYSRTVRYCKKIAFA